MDSSIKEEIKSLRGVISLSAFIGGLCCFTPVVFVLLGVSSLSFAASLSDTLYYGYRWAFRGVALLTLLGGLAYYFYSKHNVCSLDELKRQRNKVLNITLIVLTIATLLYIIWLYVIVEWIGVLLGIWNWY